MTNEMTAEEAVEILKYERDNDIFVATEYREKLHEALTKAIKALEQQPSEDCISRQAVIDFIIDNYGVGFNSLTNGIRDYLPSVTPKYTDEEIDKAQAVEQAYVDKMVELAVEKAKRPKGKWIIKDGKEQGYDIAGIKTWYIQILCDKCGFIKTAIEGHTGQYHYCPNCGAEMSGGGEDET